MVPVLFIYDPGFIYLFMVPVLFYLWAGFYLFIALVL